jgi:hypothetical protein
MNLQPTTQFSETLSQSDQSHSYIAAVVLKSFEYIGSHASPFIPHPQLDLVRK